MSRIRLDITTDAHIAALPNAKRSREYFLGSGLCLVTMKNGKRKFVVYARAVTIAGWVKSKPHLIGYWPTVGIAAARTFAREYRALATQQSKLVEVQRVPVSRPCNPITLQDALHTPWEKGY